MRVCLSCVEFFAWGKYGGFGRATRKVGRELVKRGVEVFAVVPRQRGQRAVEKLDGIIVLSFPKYRPWEAAVLYKEVNADIYHASEPSLSTYIAMKTMPDRKHIINFQDARNLFDWKKEFERPALNKLQVLSNFIYEHNFFVSIAIRKAHGVYAQAESQIPKIKSMYRLKTILPLHNPVDIPTGDINKSPIPTVGWLNRWDRVKRPELFLELAGKLPKVKFIAAGNSKHKKWDAFLRKKYGQFPNLELIGFVDQFSNPELHSRILEESWIMVNTSTKEALPNNNFLEAAAHKCAILAGLDYRDGFATSFGYCALNQDFETGLRWLLENDRWKELGEKGYAHVKEEYRTDLVIDQHLHVYESTLRMAPVCLKGTQIDPTPSTSDSNTLQ
jgi:glycosyltransferase involved in cell wall biosynthesis